MPPLASVKVATAPLNAVPAVALMSWPLAVRAASAMLAVPEPVAVLPSLSVIVTLSVKEPSSG